MQGKQLRLESQPYLRQALFCREPVVVEQIGSCETQPQSVLVVSTCYQDEPNGLISLEQCDRTRQWSEAEIELVRELAEQVGTAIAHGTLYKELELASERAEEASRLKSEFLANTSHELRTPLNGMIGFLKLILEGMADDPEEQRDFIQEAHRLAIHLHNLINDILDIAKIEAGKMELELGQVRLRELMNDVEDFTLNLAQQKNLSLNIELPAARDEIILYGNYQRLLQVLLNLIGNAIKFTHEGGVTISAEVLKKKVTFKEHELPGLIKIRVADTGIGVSLDKQDKLFQSFSQVDGSRTRSYGGTGLGLAISQRLVETMGGVVNFYSMGEGLGSTVTFTVPLYQEPMMISSQSA
jgi:signal transduction histidine kinase